MSSVTSIGAPLIRVDGPAKVKGEARYAAEFTLPELCHASLVMSTIPQGEIAAMDIKAASAAPGVIAVMTPDNAPRLPQGGKAAVHPPAGRHMQLLQDATVYYNNQPIAVVVADTLEQAIYAASLVKVRYRSAPAKLDFEGGFPSAHPGGGKAPPNMNVGNIDAGLEAAEVKVDQVYTTPIENHNPMEPHATLAQWDGPKLTLYDATQYISGVKQTVAKAMGLPTDDVRVICPFTGGGFGCKGSTWSHVVLAAMAAKVVGRPVRLALERPQMFGPVGARPRTHQHLVLGAKKTGELTAIRHDCYSHTSVFEDFTEPSSTVSRVLYASPNIAVSQLLVPLTVGTPTFQRAPGESTGSFALEIAMDELAEKLGMDPIELRLKNYAEKDPTSAKPFSSKHLKECYTQGAAEFGWAKRKAQPRATKDGDNYIGMGMATATYPANREGAMAMVKFEKNGRVTVASGSQDLGTGTYTIMAQVAAATLKLPVELMDAKLGDSTLPRAPVSGGSQSAASVTPAVQAACQQAVLKLATLAANDSASPLHGLNAADISFENGLLAGKNNPALQEDYKALLARHAGEPVSATASAEPDEGAEQYSKHSFGAVFAEVAVDATLGMVKVRRILGVYDVGTLLSEKTGKSQLIGGIVWGIGMALHEATYIDSRDGRTVNANLAEYHVPVNADIGEIEVRVLNIPDKKFNPLGARGIGEIGITGAAGAVANAVYNAIGKRVREAPITPDKLLV